VIVGVEVASLYISGPSGAVFAQRIELMMVVAEAFLFLIAPPEFMALFSERVQLTITEEELSL